jgi:hypothetical protein
MGGKDTPNVYFGEISHVLLYSTYSREEDNLVKHRTK